MDGMIVERCSRAKAKGRRAPDREAGVRRSPALKPLAIISLVTLFGISCQMHIAWTVRPMRRPEPIRILSKTLAEISLEIDELVAKSQKERARNEKIC